MKNDIFLLAKDPHNACRDMIFHRGGSMKICVYCLDKEDYQINHQELQFYSDNNGELLAFETCGYDLEDPGLIIEGIRWYANYLENPDMEILAEDPRTESNI